MKLGIAIAIAQEKSKSWKSAIKDYFKFFKNNQGMFQGLKKTFNAVEGFEPERGYMGTTMVQTTVGEKLEWLTEKNLDFFDVLFSVEATNASGLGKAELIVGDTSFGNLSTLELMRLKSILSDPSLKEMYLQIPVRSDSEIWTPCDNDDYVGRNIFENQMMQDQTSTTHKEQYILIDKNLAGKTTLEGYVPQVATKTTKAKTGDYTVQKFSGEWNQRQRAELLSRLEELRLATIQALSKANDIEVITSEFTGQKLMNYLHG